MAAKNANRLPLGDGEEQHTKTPTNQNDVMQPTQLSAEDVASENTLAEAVAEHKNADAPNADEDTSESREAVDGAEALPSKADIVTAEADSAEGEEDAPATNTGAEPHTPSGEGEGRLTDAMVEESGPDQPAPLSPEDIAFAQALAQAVAENRNADGPEADDGAPEAGEAALDGETPPPHADVVATEADPIDTARDAPATNSGAEPPRLSDDYDDEDPNVGAKFAAAPFVPGEFLVPQSKLLDWQYHPRRGSRRFCQHRAALLLTAADPLALRPIVVISKDNGEYAVKDGRFILDAVRSAHPGNEDVLVRCVEFDGTEAQAVASWCDEGLGAIGLTEMEKARILLSLKVTSGVSQTEIAGRYPTFTVTKVNNMLRAARVLADFPDLFKILQDPDKVSIDYGVKLFTAIRRMSTDELRTLLDRAKDLDDNHERFTPIDALDVLRIPVAPTKVTSEPTTEASEAAHGDAEEGQNAELGAAAAMSPQEDDEESPVAEDIFGHDDQPVGTAEELEDGSERLTLPPVAAVAAMSISEREDAAAAFIQRVRRHFGLEAGG